MSNKSFYCFRCGDPLVVVNGELYCTRGDMGISKALSDRLTSATTDTTIGEQSYPVENSSFRCFRCSAFMKQIDQSGLSFQCPGCAISYDARTIYMMVEVHPHK